MSEPLCTCGDGDDGCPDCMEDFAFHLIHCQNSYHQNCPTPKETST